MTSPAGSPVPAGRSPRTDGRGDEWAHRCRCRFMFTGVEDDVYVGAWTRASASARSARRDRDGRHCGSTPGCRRTVAASSSSPTGPAAQGPSACPGIAVTPVEFGPPINPPTRCPPTLPWSTDRLHVYDAATNAEVRPLAGNTTGVTQVAVSDDRQWVYYLLGASNVCGAGTLMRTRLDGTGTPTKVDTGGSRSPGLRDRRRRTTSSWPISDRPPGDGPDWCTGVRLGAGRSRRPEQVLRPWPSPSPSHPTAPAERLAVT